MKKKTKKKNKINGYKIVGLLLMICSIIFLGAVLLAGVLPIKYLSILIGVLLLLNLIINFFLFKRKIKKKPRKFFTVVALLLSIVFLGGSFYIYKTLGFLEDMSQDYAEYTYSVLVKSDSTYQKLQDISDTNLGYYNNNNDATKKALGTLSKKVSTTNEGYGNLESLGSDLLNKKINSILVEDSQKTKLDNAGSSTGSNNAISGFKDKTRVLYKFKVRIPIKSDGINVTKDVINIYISGMDEYGEVQKVSRSDVNMVVTINPKTKQILLTNIPRDYYVQLHDTTGYKDKLTHAGIYGLDTSVETIEDLLGIDINYYFKVNFSSLVNIVDALGGVEVYSEYDFQSWNGYNFSKGYNKVNGKEALSFVRERKTFNEGDNQRGRNQQAMIEAIFRKCTNPSIIIKYNSLLNSLEDSMITDMPMRNITKLAKMQLRNNAKWTITSNSLTGTGSSEYTYTYPYQSLYVTIADEESLKLSKEMIKKVQDGEILESSYNADSSDVHSVTKSSVYKSSSSSTKTTKKKTKTKKVTEVKPQENITDMTETETKTEDTQVVDPTTNDQTSTNPDTGNNNSGDDTTNNNNTNNGSNNNNNNNTQENSNTQTGSNNSSQP